MADKHKKPSDLQKTDSAVMRSSDAGDGDSTSGKKQKHEFPDTLEGFGYQFSDKRELKSISTGEPFVFKVKEDHHYNQRRYEALGEIITNYVYDLLQQETKLKKVELPVDAKEDEPKSFFFVSEDAMTNEKLILLIHGSGVVRAGQWARRLIINDCLDSGTQLPFIKKSVEDGYGVMVFNTNLNRVITNGRTQLIRENSSPDDHGQYVWDNFVKKAAAKHIAIIAHSYGGVVTTNLAIEKGKEFTERVFAIAFTDSVHSLMHQNAPEPIFEFYEKNAKNWVSSEEPLDTPIPNIGSMGRECPKVSAGHPKHENTSWSSFESIFKYLGEKYPVKTTKSEL